MFRPLALTALLLLAPPAFAHEFWIDPLDFAPPPDAPVRAEIRVGQNFVGAGYSFNPQQFRRFDIVTADGVVPVEGRAGDRPALDMALPEPGLAILVHQTTDTRLRYTEWEKFVTFCTHKDFRWVLERHEARGLPRSDFRELYSRHAKALVAAGGDGAGQDRVVGLTVEIVALANPYTDDLSDGLPVQVVYQGQVRADVQVELFARDPDGEVSVSLHRTGPDGIARLPVVAGHSYLADHVVMRELDPGDDPAAPVWESLWASLTFAVPE